MPRQFPSRSPSPFNARFRLSCNSALQDVFPSSVYKKPARTWVRAETWRKNVGPPLTGTAGWNIRNTSTFSPGHTTIPLPVPGPILYRKMYVVFERQRFVHGIVVPAFMRSIHRAYSSTRSHFSVLPPPALRLEGCANTAASRTESPNRKRAAYEILVRVTRFALVFAGLHCIPFLPFPSFSFDPFHFRLTRLILSREKAFIHPEWFIPFVRLPRANENKKAD